MRKYIGEASYAEQIQAEQYEEVMSYASVNMRFDYSIPVEEFIKEKNYKIRPEYGAFPDRPYDSPGVWGDAEKINLIMKNHK